MNKRPLLLLTLDDVPFPNGRCGGYDVAVPDCERYAPVRQGDARVGIFVSLNPATGVGVLGDAETEIAYRFTVSDIDARKRFVGLARGAVVDYVLGSGSVVLAVDFVGRKERRDAILNDSSPDAHADVGRSK